MSIAESYSKNLPEDEALHEHMYDLFPGLVYLYDLDQNKFRFLKGKIKESLGFSGEDLNDDFEKVIFKDDVPLVRKELKRFLELSKNDLHTYHCRLNRKDGDYLHFHVTGKVLRYHSDGKPASILFVAQDIHDHVLSVEAAQVSLEVLNDSENLLRFATWKWDIHSNEVTWSRGICALLNYNSSEYEKIKSGNALMNFVLGELAHAPGSIAAFRILSAWLRRSACRNCDAGCHDRRNTDTARAGR